MLTPYRYRVTFITPSDQPERISYQNVIRYKMMPNRVFYVAGTGFEQWICLGVGDIVQVTEEED